VPKASSAKVLSQSPELAELVSIKRLLTFALLKSGTTQKEVAAALGVTQGTISKMLAGEIPKQIRRKASD
jgi:predicted transcriptional regulator